MNLTHDQLDELALILENESEFYRAYQRVKNATFGQRRSAISNYFYERRGKKLPHPDIEARDQLRRYFDDRYEFDQSETNKYAHIPYWRDPVEKKTLDSYAKLKAAHAAGQVIEISAESGNWITAVKPRFTLPLDRYRIKAEIDAHVDRANEHFQRVEDALNPTKETTVSKPIEITTKTLINGADITGMSDAEIFSLISNQEAEIEALEKIKTKPKKLVAEIAKRQAGIAALVAYLDSKED